MKYSVCIDALYKGKDFFESLEKAKAIGHDYFEFWSWWDKDILRLKEEKDRLQMTVTTFCTRFISLVDPLQRNAYINALGETIDIAKQLGCKQIITQTGNDTQEDRKIQQTSLIEGLKACDSLLEENDITLLVEPLNTKINHNGYYLHSSDEAFEIINQVGSTRVKVLFDIYHQQIMEGDILRRIANNIDKIGHFHIAGVPGRHEPDSGELNYNVICEEIKKMNFKGYIGLEYFPLNEPETSLRKFISQNP